jgi:hypothetical protein
VESRDIAGMLSQLPAEVSVEDTVKVHVLGLQPRTDGRCSTMAAAGGASGAGALSMAPPAWVAGGGGEGGVGPTSIFGTTWK